jgi:hypothetical protein
MSNPVRQCAFCPFSETERETYFLNWLVPAEDDKFLVCCACREGFDKIMCSRCAYVKRNKDSKRTCSSSACNKKKPCLECQMEQKEVKERKDAANRETKERDAKMESEKQRDKSTTILMPEPAMDVEHTVGTVLDDCYDTNPHLKWAWSRLCRSEHGPRITLAMFLTLRDAADQRIADIGSSLQDALGELDSVILPIGHSASWNKDAAEDSIKSARKEVDDWGKDLEKQMVENTALCVRTGEWLLNKQPRFGST